MKFVITIPLDYYHKNLKKLIGAIYRLIKPSIRPSSLFRLGSLESLPRPEQIPARTISRVMRGGRFDWPTSKNPNHNFDMYSNYTKSPRLEKARWPIIKLSLWALSIVFLQTRATTYMKHVFNWTSSLIGVVSILNGKKKWKQVHPIVLLTV